jgi:LmbE family N-acetylglucosaminyl deacetylase/glycosyltransferase involved in cell wall biosynthesis
MLTEDALIPFHSADPTGKKALVLAPHPDDETFGCGGTLALHARADDPVKVIFLTNGIQGDSSGKYDKDEYVKLRQNEAKKACACLAVTDLEFWPYNDRSLAGSRGALRRMIDLLKDFRPRIVYAPSLLEFHPDHRAACVLLCDALHSHPMDLDVAFYEIGQPVRVNLLVDITGVSEQKAQAVDAYQSQLRERPYGDISRALARFRSLTLAEDAVYAEGFSVWRSDIIRKIGVYSIPLQQAERLLPGPGEAGPLVSVIVRTKDRPVLLATALTSIAHQTYANLEIVVVNDGGQDVQDVATASAGGIPVTYIAHETSRGRAAAANAGLKAAKGLYLNFLDDDDVFLPDHVETLVSYLIARDEKVAYSNALSVYFTGPVDRPAHRVKEELVFHLEFDPEILLFQNYIPLMSVLFSRDVLSESEGFCEAMDLFEDWDFWIRVSRHFTFHHVDKITAEYRFYGVTDAETAHRGKYTYDSALAAVFDRARPLLSGKAWVNFLNNGSMGRFRLSGLATAAKMAELEQRVSAYQKEILGLKERLEEHEARVFGTDVSTGPYADRQQRRKGIERANEMACFAVNAAYRVWIKLKDIIRK